MPKLDRTANDIDRHVGRRIRERRIALGLSQTELGALMGVTYQQEHKYETAQNRLSCARLYQAAQALGVEVDWFFEGLDNGFQAPDLAQLETLELAHNFRAASPREQRAIAGLARTFASEDAP